MDIKIDVTACEVFVVVHRIQKIFKRRQVMYKLQKKKKQKGFFNFYSILCSRLTIMKLYLSVNFQKSFDYFQNKNMTENNDTTHVPPSLTFEPLGYVGNHSSTDNPGKLICFFVFK